MNKLLIFAGLGIGAITWFESMKLFNDRRGLRNNNPGNIERNSTQWEGMAADQSADSRFVVFESPEYGIRAMARILKSYNRRGLVTVSQIIGTWAPENENDTGAYIDSVAASTGLDKTSVVTEERYPDLIAAIIKHENGIQPYSDELIKSGVALA